MTFSSTGRSMVDVGSGSGFAGGFDLGSWSEVGLVGGLGMSSGWKGLGVDRGGGVKVLFNHPHPSWGNQPATIIYVLL